mgnify:CR=1 FL=1
MKIDETINAIIKEAKVFDFNKRVDYDDKEKLKEVFNSLQDTIQSMQGVSNISKQNDKLKTVMYLITNARNELKNYIEKEE